VYLRSFICEEIPSNKGKERGMYEYGLSVTLLPIHSILSCKEQ